MPCPCGGVNDATKRASDHLGSIGAKYTLEEGAALMRKRFTDRTEE